MIQLLQTLLNWALGALGAHGYIITFVATIMENIFIFGSFTPGDTIAAAAAFVATTPAGHALSPWLLLGVATAGTFIGANISYIIGWRGGIPLIERMGPRFGIGLKSIEAGEEYFLRHGAATIVLARFIAVLKNLTPALAGASRMNLFWFEVYSFIGALGYSAVVIGVGWFLGANFQAGLKYFGAFSWALFAVAVAVGVVLFLAKRRRDARLVAENAAEFAEEFPDEAARLGEVFDGDEK